MLETGETIQASRHGYYRQPCTSMSKFTIPGTKAQVSMVLSQLLTGFKKKKMRSLVHILHQYISKDLQTQTHNHCMLVWL